jgi:hypothetical protein
MIPHQKKEEFCANALQYFSPNWIIGFIQIY